MATATVETAGKTTTSRKTSGKGRSFLNELNNSLDSSEKKAAASSRKPKTDSKEMFGKISPEAQVKKAEVVEEDKPSEVTSHIKKGYKGWAWIDEHSKYYRARVTEVLGEDEFKVLYRDFFATVKASDLVEDKPDNLKVRIEE